MKLGFCGDLCLNGSFLNQFLNQEKILENNLSILLHQNDFNIVNLEGPVTNSNTFIKDKGIVKSPQGTIKYLGKENINVFNLANNHMFDFGMEGYNDTIKEINKENFQYFGAGKDFKEASKPLILRDDNVSIALIGFAHDEGLLAKGSSGGVLNYSNHNFLELKKLIKEVNLYVDHIIINYHGGEEFTLLPIPSRRKFLKRIINIPEVSAIIAHHSHVFQGIEIVKQKPIFYSLGNFMFDLDIYRNKRFNHETAIVNLEISKSKIIFNLIPVSINLEEGVLSLNNSESGFNSRIKKNSEFEKYWRNWFNDSYKTFFYSDDKNSFNVKKSKDHTSKSSRNLLQKFIIVIKLIQKKNKKEIFISALIYKYILRFLPAFNKE